jgi:hypothetical protein
MLDHDPVAAARAHCDAHLRNGLYAYAQVLAYAWHSLHNEGYAELADDMVPTPWFTHHHSVPYTNSADRPRTMFPGESPFSWWLLFGQRVPSPPFTLPNDAMTWCEALGGNYRWLWQTAMEMVREHQHRFGKPHPARWAIWTLEVIPFALEETVDQWQETPVSTVPNHLRIQVEGFYDVVATNRRFYNSRIAPAAWTKRHPPKWHQQEAEATTEPA